MKLDTGFRVFKVGERLIKENGKVDRDASRLDLFFDAMLKTGVMPSKPFKSYEVGGNKIFKTITELVACFDEPVSDETLAEILEIKPCFLVVADMSRDWETLLPDTVVKFIEFEDD